MSPLESILKSIEQIADPQECEVIVRAAVEHKDKLEEQSLVKYIVVHRDGVRVCSKRTIVHANGSRTYNKLEFGGELLPDGTCKPQSYVEFVAEQAKREEYRKNWPRPFDENNQEHVAYAKVANAFTMSLMDAPRVAYFASLRDASECCYDTDESTPPHKLFTVSKATGLVTGEVQPYSRENCSRWRKALIVT